jgi:hypothetical protein
VSAPIVAVKAAIRARLQADAALGALIRAPKIHDDPPRGRNHRADAYPWLAFSAGRASDLGTSGGEGAELRLTLTAVTRLTGEAEAAAIADAVTKALRAPFGLQDGQRIVTLAVTGVETARTRDGETVSAVIAIRAVTEEV